MQKRVLVVDDDEALRRAVARLLESRGYSVVEAPDGSAALKRLADEEFHLVIADLIMPGVEGIELIRIVRRQHPDVKIIAISGSPFAIGGKYLQIATKMGASRTLTKPFVTSEMIEAIEELLKD